MRRRRHLNGLAVLLESVTGIDRQELLQEDETGAYIDPTAVRNQLRAEALLDQAGEETDDECD